MEPESGYRSLLDGVSALLEGARKGAARTVNSIITATYWEVGRRIVENEQSGKAKPDYGDQIIKRLAADLTSRFGRGFSRRNVFQMRQFYLAYRDAQPARSGQAPSPQRKKVQTASALLPGAKSIVSFPLPWSHYVRLLSVDDQEARAFYEAEALRGGWSVRQLDRQISALFFQRTAHSKRALIGDGKRGQAVVVHALSAEQEIKDPLVLEFLGLKDEYSESDLEEALVSHLEHFLLELGNDFAFLARQKRLRVGDEWYRIDLLFFHRHLRCLIVIDLKLGKFTHADAGQMNLYLNYAREHWTNPDEHPPVGLILCSEKDEAVAHYALGNLANTVLAREYKLTLPKEKELVRELTRQRRALELEKD
jgi:predicted nuclease of restriction endonuclease-like (RecB) superfamily